MAGIASSATAVLVGYLAGGTHTIRVGSGGVMLPNHAPLVVAEAFGTLAESVSGPHRPGPGPRAGHRPGHPAGFGANAPTGRMIFRRMWPSCNAYLGPRSPASG